MSNGSMDTLHLSSSQERVEIGRGSDNDGGPNRASPRRRNITSPNRLCRQMGHSHLGQNSILHQCLRRFHSLSHSHCHSTNPKRSLHLGCLHLMHSHSPWGLAPCPNTTPTLHSELCRLRPLQNMEYRTVFGLMARDVRIFQQLSECTAQ